MVCETSFMCTADMIQMELAIMVVLSRSFQSGWVKPANTLGTEFMGEALDDVDGITLVKAADVIIGTESANLFDIAINSGLLLKVNNYYFLLNVPLVEFCTGKFLANDVIANVTAPRLLIETFNQSI